MPPPPRGRGAATSPPGRFERLVYEPDPEMPPEELPAPVTQLLRDVSRSALATNDSPDIGFDASLNPYRGCEHGCAYCYARPTHEYLGFSAGLDFETKILVKEGAPELLRKELSSPRWKPQVVALSGVTDAYQPAERALGLTRRCLAVLAEFRNPVAVVTKNELVARDADLLAGLARHDAAAVLVSITSLDPSLTRALEPRTSAPERRLAAIAALARAGVPAGVLIGPVIPALNDHEIPRILEAAATAGARHARFIVLRLPGAVAGIFEAWLDAHRPERKAKILSGIRSLRAGRLNDPRFFARQRGEGATAEAIARLFAVACRRHGLSTAPLPLSTAAFRVPRAAGQLPLFS